MKRTTIAIAALCLCIAGTAAVAQTAGTNDRTDDSAGFVLVVTNEFGHVLQGAEVRIEDSDGRELVGTTDDDGRVTFPAAPSGRYRVEVDSPGFRGWSSELDLRVDGKPVTVELTARFVQTVVVTSTLPGLATESRIDQSALREASRSDLAESILTEPSLDATRRGSINLDPQVRGLQEYQVAMFVDGTRTFAAGPGRMDSELSHVDLRSVKEVRAIKGPYALTWGAGTLSALQVETYRPEFSSAGLETEGHAGLQYGSNADRADAHVGFSGATERLRFNVFGGYRTGSDYEDGDGNTIPGDYESGNLTWMLGYSNGAGLTIDYNGGYQEQSDVDYPGRMLDARYFYTHSNAVRFEWKPSERRHRMSGQVYANRKDHLMNNDDKPSAEPNPGGMPPFGRLVEVPTESDTWGGQIAIQLDRGPLQWTIGTDFYFLNQKAVRTISGRDTGMLMNQVNAWPDAQINDQGVYAQLIHAKAKSRIGGTVRVDFVQSSADSNLVSDWFLENTTGELEQSESDFSAAVNGTVRVSPSWELTAGLGQAVRAPNALERYSDRFPYSKFQIAAEFVGSPDIRSETSVELDVEATGTAGPLSLSAGAFYRVIDDYITVVPDPSLSPSMPMSYPVVYRHVNGDQARFTGGELRMIQAFRDHWSWRGSVSYVWAEDTSFDEPVFGIPPLQGEVGIRYAFGARRPAWIDAGGLFVDRQDRVATTRLEIETPGYSVFGLRGGVQLTRSLELHAALENIGDKTYTRHLNSLDPFTGERVAEIGRRIIVGIDYGF